MSCQVRVSEGILQGCQRETYEGIAYYSFEGVPYAKPPVGCLRFQEPQVPEQWTGVRDASKPGNKCAQIDPYSQKSFQGSEDCLYLNVYTPSLPFEKYEKLPVLFFVHGGRFIVGYADYYKPDYLIRHNVILVTTNYRLNILGFLALDIKEAPGNCGLKDTVMALKWVRKNISRFNGDQNNITAFGESAGAAITSSYITSRATDGLVNKIIAQSGNCLSDLFMRDDDCVEKGRKVAAMLGSKATEEKSIYDFLVTVPVEDLVIASAVLESSRHPTRLDAYFLPVVEKCFDGVQRYFEESPIVTIKENRYKKIPILTGLSLWEGALFVTRDENGNINYEKDLRHFIPRYMHIKEGSDEEFKIVKRIEHFYFDGNDFEKSKYIRFISDTYFDRDMMMFLNEIAKNQNDLFYYRFSYEGSMNTRVMKNIGLKGATHGDIVQYLFYKKAKADNSSIKDKEVVNFLSETWCNFAKHGKPTWINQGVHWHPYALNKRCTLDIDCELKIFYELGYDRYLFWKSLSADTCKL